MTTVTPPHASPAEAPAPAPASIPTPASLPAPPTDVTTAAGVGLQAAWAGYVLYGLWLASAAPEHPLPPAWLDAVLTAVTLGMFAVTAGLLGRRRWALWGSTVLALPMVGLAVMCFQAGAGNHWMAEAGFAGAIVAGSVHPASWRMHTR